MHKSAWVFQPLQLILLAMFGVGDEPLAFCVVVHVYFNGFKLQFVPKFSNTFSSENGLFYNKYFVLPS